MKLCWHYPFVGQNVDTTRWVDSTNSNLYLTVDCHDNFVPNNFDFVISIISLGADGAALLLISGFWDFEVESSLADMVLGWVVDLSPERDLLFILLKLLDQTNSGTSDGWKASTNSLVEEKLAELSTEIHSQYNRDYFSAELRKLIQASVVWAGKCTYRQINYLIGSTSYVHVATFSPVSLLVTGSSFSLVSLSELGRAVPNSATFLNPASRYSERRFESVQAGSRSGMSTARKTRCFFAPRMVNSRFWVYLAVLICSRISDSR